MNAYFVGEYTRTLAKVCTASLLSGTHAMALSGPGTGKTAILESVVRQVVPNAWCMVRCDPSTPPEKIKGAIDVKRYLADGEFAENVDGTPFDPNMRVVILDEMSRASEIVQHLNIQLLDRARGRDVYNYPVVWGTANFVKVANQLEALYDRVGLWYHLPNEEIDVLAFVQAQAAGRMNGGLRVNYPLPTWEQIETVRTCEYGENAIKTVARFIETIVGELAIAGLKVNRRRLEQWQRILLACSAYEHGTGDFSALSPLALEVFPFAWAAPKPEDQSKFQEIVAACADPTQHALDAAYASVMSYMQAVAAIADESSRRLKIGEMGQLIAKQQQELTDAGVDPQTTRAAALKFSAWFAQALNGEEVTE